MLDEVLKSTEARRLTDLLRAGSEQSEVFAGKGTLHERDATLQLVLEGAVLRQRFLADGRRQTVSVYYRDDVINLTSYVGAKRQNPDYLMVLKGTVVGSVSDEAVAHIRATTPPHMDGISVLAFRELGIAQARVTSITLRSSAEAMAHFFCETLLRCARITDNYKTNRCTLHMTQEMLGSVLGISSVHVNRTLQDLRRRKLADVVDHELVVYDFEGLATLAEFDDAYLAPI